MAESTVLQAVLGRDRYLVLGSLAGVVIGAWLYLLYLAQGMSGVAMNAGEAMAMAKAAPWRAGDFLATFLMWVVMMVGMMLPSAAPMILIFAGIGRKRRAEGGQFTSTGIFTVGYVLAWTGFSLAATILQWGLQSLLLLSPMIKTTSPIVGGALIVVAGAYQLSPLKTVCLKHCRSPLAFLLTRWRNGSQGALRMGFEHGMFCLGCCWALMVLLFVGGVMNLFWVAAIALFVLLEKLVPRGELWGRLGGGALMVVGTVLAFSA